ncbi:XdhC family protein [Nakamurella deserti]|uniref:XdhC family protein n=1 Tax=Nakamurella deserti TaxID=2164074 RepID=UPI000DBE83C1|nr:XdhC family protein [Nakamurella deserti]
MREAMPELHRWWAQGDRAGMATVVRTYASAPRPPGATMLVGPDGAAVGSVSGGCVEGAVYELATAVRDGAPPELQRYGISDELAASVGITCGGVVDVFVEPVDRTSFPELGMLVAAVEAGEPVALATVIGGDRAGRHLLVFGETPGEARRRAGGLGSARLDDAVTDDALGLLTAGRSDVLRYGPDGERRGDGLEVVVDSFAPPPRMIVFGAIDFAAAVAEVGRFLGYRVTVCDARPVFATARRFPGVDEVVVDWPHRYLAGQAAAGALDERTVVCVLTHDPKFDVPLLEVALRLPIGYVGAMGSRQTHLDRLDKLRAAGVTAAELARLSSPIGLDLGARTPAETAISVAAEIIARQWHGRGRPLSELTGPIHHARLGLPAQTDASAPNSSSSRS